MRGYVDIYGNLLVEACEYTHVVVGLGGGGVM